jgi:hypothetical protein
VIESIVKEFLDNHLNMPVLLEKKRNLTGKFVLLEKTGGTSRNQLHSATVAVQSYADSLYEAALLNQEIKNVMSNLIEVENVSGVHLNSDYNFTDTETKQYRYQAVFDINYC